MASRFLGRIVAAYAITAIIWVAAAPLVAAHYHLISPIGILIGPLVVPLTSIALIAGFLLLAAALVWWPLTIPFAWVTGWSLAACKLIVKRTQEWPGSYWYVGDLPQWWLWAFWRSIRDPDCEVAAARGAGRRRLACRGLVSGLRPTVCVRRRTSCAAPSWLLVMAAVR